VKCELTKISQLLIKERAWTIDCPGIYQEFGYQDKGGVHSSNFANCEVSICEKEIRTIGSWELWTLDLTMKLTS
jgi:hypothetical protein